MQPDISIRVSFAIPPKPKRPGRKPVYGFGRLKVGEWFVSDRPRDRVAPAAAMYGRKHGMKFSVTGDGPGLLRVTRVS